MANQELATYLNDHLAGSVAALDLLAQLEREGAGTAEATVLASVRSDILADRQALEDLLTQLDISVSTPRQATAWLMEQLSALKLRLDDPGHGALRRLEALEAIALAIAGKQALWHALAAVAEGAPELGRLPYDELLGRGANQQARIETLRLQAALAALAPRG